ncbi:hypothetical protein D5085_04475 [Ectothiorhodospiraceae bacterium BW-2]|nr:hypothetical protein D5085_04475 [Ectothiorhodospiraceae bacterium BW-2]
MGERGENAAKNRLARLFDPDIDRLTPYRQMKATCKRGLTATAQLGLQLLARKGVINGERMTEKRL